MEMTRDTAADAVYIYVSKEPVDHTVVVTDSVNIDVDSKGSAVGIEILDASVQQELITSIQTSLRKDISISTLSASSIQI